MVKSHSHPAKFESLVDRQSVRFHRQVLRSEDPRDPADFAAFVLQPASLQIYADLATLASQRAACREARERAIERAFAVRHGHHDLFDEISERRRQRARRDRGGACWRQLRGELAEKDPMSLPPIGSRDYAQVLQERYGSFGFRQKRLLGLHGRPTVTYHLARDIMLPPGSPIFSPVDGEVIDVEFRRTYSVIELVDDRDRYWRLLHMDKKHVAVEPGAPLFEGQLIGYTSFRRLPKSSSHLHIEIWESREEREAAMERLIDSGARRVAAYGRSLRPEPAALDPLEQLGAEGLNVLLGMTGPAPEQPERAFASFRAAEEDPTSSCSGAQLRAARAERVQDDRQATKVCSLANLPKDEVRR